MSTRSIYSLTQSPYRRNIEAINEYCNICVDTTDKIEFNFGVSIVLHLKQVVIIIIIFCLSTGNIWILCRIMDRLHLFMLCSLVSGVGNRVEKFLCTSIYSVQFVCQPHPASHTTGCQEPWWWCWTWAWPCSASSATWWSSPRSGGGRTWWASPSTWWPFCIDLYLLLDLYFISILYVYIL